MGQVQNHSKNSPQIPHKFHPNRLDAPLLAAYSTI
jgi:hypothetical protein